MKVDNCRLAFVAQQEVTALDAVHKAVLGKAACAGRMAEDVEGRFLVRISVGIVEAHPVPWQVVKSSPAQMVGQNVSGGLPRRGVAAPAFGIIPSVAPAGGVHVNGYQTDVHLAQLGADAVDPPAALFERDVFVFRNKQISIKVETPETRHDTGGDFAVVGPLEDTAVGRTLPCCVPAVSVVNQDFHRTWV